MIMMANVESSAWFGIFAVTLRGRKEFKWSL